MSDQEVAALARAAGLLVAWEDADGNPQTVSPENLRRILAALGHRCQTPVECAESLRQLEAPEPLCFITADAGNEVRLVGLRGPARLIMESGAARDVSVCEDGTGLTLAEPGYHRLEHEGGEITIAVAPSRATSVETAARRPWGVAVQIYALRAERRSAFGDFGALGEFARASARCGADAVAISPVHALFTADPGHYSPYAPSSRDFLNPLFADPALIGLGDEEAGGRLIDWSDAWPKRIAVLRQAWTQFAQEEGQRLDAFHGYVAAGGKRLWLHAVFEALHGHFLRVEGARSWQGWPGAFRDPGSAAVAEFAAAQADEVGFHAFLQWLAERSLGQAQRAASDAGMRIGLVADLAVGLDPGGSHAWSRPDELLAGLGIGAPPDAFQAEGQSWGLTTFSPQALRRTGFGPFIAMLRAAMRHAGAIRIDHALGLRRLWLVPDGGSPLDGAYLRMPEEDLLRLIALESHRAGAAVIGEDLGVVPAGFRQAIAARGMLGMRVLPFERDAAGAFLPSQTWDRDAVAMTSTHDLVPVAGWWSGWDIDQRERRGGETLTDAREERAQHRIRLWDACVAAGCAHGSPPAKEDPEPALDAAVAFTAAARCDLALFPAEDLFAIEQAPNLPGTVDEHPNWRRRLPAAADALFAMPGAVRRVALINKARKQ